MGRYTLEQRTEILETYLQCGESSTQTVRKLKKKFAKIDWPSTQFVDQFVKRVRKTGTLIDKTTRSRSRTVLTAENIAAVARSVHENPSISTRRRSQQLNISRTSLLRILHSDLGDLLSKSDETTEAVPKKPVVARGRSHHPESGKNNFRVIVAPRKRKGRPKKLQKTCDAEAKESEVADVENDDDQKDADVEKDDDQKDADVENDDEQKDGDVENDDDQKDAEVENDDVQKDGDIENDDDQKGAVVENDDDQKDAYVENDDDQKNAATEK